jgi:GR25 family glycosyltransferase involved in LPS biosynthesis
MLAALLGLASALRLSAYSAPSAGDAALFPASASGWQAAGQKATGSIMQEVDAAEFYQMGDRSPLAATWYINLDSYTGRRKVMESAYSSSGLRYQRFPAVRPTTGSLAHGQWNHLYTAYHPSRKSDLHDPHLVARIRGEIGCLASHTVLLKHILATGRPGEVYMIAEDDYTPAPDFASRLPAALALLPADWDVLRLDCWAMAGGVPLQKLPEVEPGLFWNSVPGCSAQDSEPTGKKQCYFCGGTHAVLVAYEKVQRLLDLWSGSDGPLYPADCMLTRPDYKNYCLQWGLMRPVREFLNNTSIPKSADKVKSWHLHTQTDAKATTS